MKLLGSGVLAACTLCLALAGSVQAADESFSSVPAPPADQAQIQLSGEAALSAAQQSDRAGTQSYLEQNAADQKALADRLADTSAQVSRVAGDIDALQAQMARTDRRISIEQDQLRILARAIYQQPESPLLAIGTARSLMEAFTRVADLLSTGNRALQTKRSLELDLARTHAEQTSLRAELDRQEELSKRLEADFQTLQHYAGAVQQTQDQVRAAAGLIPHADGPTQARMQDVIRQTWASLGPAAVVWAQRIAYCESTYNPYSVNRSSAASGLFQFLPSTWAGTPYASQSPFDPVANSAAAAWLYQRYGPRQWECSYRV